MDNNGYIYLWCGTVRSAPGVCAVCWGVRGRLTVSNRVSYLAMRSDTIVNGQLALLLLQLRPLGCGAFARPPSLLRPQLSLFAVVAAVSAREASFRAYLSRWEATRRLGGNMPVPCRYAAAASPGYASARAWIFELCSALYPDTRPSLPRTEHTARVPPACTNAPPGASVCVGEAPHQIH